jgi:ABC-2 type transport system permease protein
MDRVFLVHTLSAQRTKLLIVGAALAVWGLLMPIIYAQIIETEIGAQIRLLVESGTFPEQFTQFGGGNIFTLAGSIALGAIHPIAVALACVLSVGFGAAAVAGERQRGTLEVLLARPLSRRAAYGSLLVAMIVFVCLATAAGLAGSVVSSAIFGVLDELDVSKVPLLWLNVSLLYVALGSIALAASVSFDRLAPALGVALAVTVVSYFFEVLGSLWETAQPLQPLSVFHYVDPQAVLDGHADPFDFLLLAAVALAGVVWSLVVFPRRDVAAPS